MRTTSGYLLCSVLAVGCYGAVPPSDPVGPTPSVDEAEAAIVGRTGTFVVSPRTVASFNVAFRRAELAGLGGTAETSAEAKALRTNALLSVCEEFSDGRASGSCPCAEGGRFAFIQEENTSRFSFSSCTDSATTFEGRATMRTSKGVLLPDLGHLVRRQPSSSVVVMEGRLSTATSEDEILLRAVTQEGRTWVLVPALGGEILVSTTEPASAARRSIVVADRANVWSCKVDGDSGECIDKKGEKKTFGTPVVTL